MFSIPSMNPCSKLREDDLVAGMRKQLSIGYSDMCQRTVEAVETTRAEHRKELTRLEEDRQHFVSALADSMNEVTRLRTKHLDYSGWEDGDEHYDECGENDDLDQWYETGYPDAAGVGTFGYDEGV